MKTIKTLFVIIIAFSFTSCQKEYSMGEDTPLPPASSKVKTYSEDIESGGAHTTITFNLAYNADNKVISMTSAASPGDRFEYRYSGDSFTMDLYNSGVLSIHLVAFLNSFSIDSTFQYNATNDSTTEKYIYNTDKQLILLKEYEYSLITGAVLSNTWHYEYGSRGNVIKETDDYTVTTFDYYPDLVNNLVFGVPYMQVNAGLVKTTTVFNGVDTIILNHVYTFDAANRIVSEKITSAGGYVATKTYTYY